MMKISSHWTQESRFWGDWVLTHKAGNEHPGDPLLPHLLDLGLVTRCNGGTHYRQRVDMGNRADCGSCEPGQSE